MLLSRELSVLTCQCLVLKEIGDQLQLMFAEIVAEPLPDEMQSLLADLEQTSEGD